MAAKLVRTGVWGLGGLGPVSLLPYRKLVTVNRPEKLKIGVQNTQAYISKAFRIAS